MPEGTVTVVVTAVDDEGLADRETSSQWDSALVATVADHEGVVLEEADAGFVAVFARASEAVSCAIELQRVSRRYTRKPRVSVHSGDVDADDADDYDGRTLKIGRQLRDASHSGQIVVSQATAELVRDHLPEEASLLDLGRHRIGDLTRPHRIHQLCHPDLPSMFPPPNRSETAPNNLRMQETSFIGRDKQMRDLKFLLTSAQLVTLVGAGGCGKTRLALEIAGEVTREYAGGVWFVDLTPLGATEPGVAAAVAQALEVREDPGVPLTDSVADAIGNKKVFVLLDNCEHHSEETALLAAALVNACPSLRIIATSRQSLGAPSESIYRLDPLDLGDIDDPDDLAAASRAEAVQLFCDRASRARPAFSLTAHLQPVVTICRELDGIPLAIELAAARVRVLTPQRIADRLHDRLRLLRGDDSAELPRQQTLAASLDWSHDLLTDLEKVLFRRLAVFRGGATIEAIEEVCGFEPLESHQVLDQLSSLIEKSLVVVDEGDAEPRFRMLETIQGYASKQLEAAGDETPVRDRHLDHFTVLAERADGELTGPRQKDWRRLLRAESNNIAGALAWAAESGRAEVGCRLADACLLFWYTHGQYSDTSAAVLRIVESTQKLSAGGRAKGLMVGGLLQAGGGDFEGAVEPLQEALELAQGAGETRVVARAASMLGSAAMLSDLSAGTGLIEMAAAAAGEVNDLWMRADTTQTLGLAHLLRGDLGPARKYLEEAIEMSRAAGHDVGVGEATTLLAEVGHREGMLADARALFQDAIVLNRSLNAGFWVSVGLAMKADLETTYGDYGTARELVDESLRIMTPMSAIAMPIALGAGGRLDRVQGNPEGAVATLQQAKLVAADVGTTSSMASWVLVPLAAVSIDLNEMDSARNVLDEALALATAQDNLFVECHVRLQMSRLLRLGGDIWRAENEVHASLELAQQMGTRPLLIDCLEQLAAIALELDKAAEAARLYAAAGFARDGIGYARPANEEVEFEAARTTLSTEEDAWKQGAALSLADAAEFVRRGRGRRKRPASGWASLTPTELRVTELVAEGLSNPKIAERLFIATRTVQTHLTHVFAKLDVSSRAELASRFARREDQR